MQGNKLVLGYRTPELSVSKRGMKSLLALKEDMISHSRYDLGTCGHPNPENLKCPQD